MRSQNSLALITQKNLSGNALNTTPRDIILENFNPRTETETKYLDKLMDETPSPTNLIELGMQRVPKQLTE